uniref:Uncharacterized protein n=1 Tax=Anguilla anguilla TaxID=7936 RepID=A0A0E9XWL5_ANGAN
MRACVKWANVTHIRNHFVCTVNLNKVLQGAEAYGRSMAVQ